MDLIKVSEEAAAVMKLLPQVLSFIIAVQGLFGPGSGETRKAVVMSGVASAPPVVQGHVSAFIDHVVPILKGPKGPIPRIVAKAA